MYSWKMLESEQVVSSESKQTSDETKCLKSLIYAA